MSRTADYRAALEAIERVLNRGGDADEVLREVVRILHERVYGWAGILFVDEGALVLGPEAGTHAGASEPSGVPIRFRDTKVAELVVDPHGGDAEEQAFLERVATIVSPYCLVGWDTGGVPWSAL